jgi:N-dimethylarginine dimethylaminohydrolase
MTPTLLMCPPLYYGIEYEINPWMRTSRQADRELARRQWDGLFDLLTRKVKARVRLVEPVQGLPDMVFTANAGIVRGKKAILSNFRFPQRAGEADHFGRWFLDNGYILIRLPAATIFEGEGDALFAGERLYSGYQFRSDIASHAAVADVFHCETLSLELVDKRFYHLDTCFCPISADTLVYFRPAFDEYAQRLIESNFPRRIAVVEEEAARFACNAVVVGDSVVMNAGCEKLRADLTGAGMTVYETDLSEFLKAGGSAKCLTLFT